jgi:hypothetical protein
MEYLFGRNEMAIYNDGGADQVEFRDPLSGALIRSLNNPGGLASTIEGLAWDGANLWLLGDTILWRFIP